jgi:hypothetical protein
MNARLFASILLVVTVAGPALTAETLDPAVIGTWKLEWPGADVYWAIRPDGVYRLHGPGANPRQLGRIEANQGRFSMKSRFWADSGAYRLSDPNTWVITGQFGPGTWKRVWRPTSKGSQGPPGPGLCALLTVDEVAQALRAPVSGGPDRVGRGGCLFKSLLSEFDHVAVDGHEAWRETWQFQRRAGERLMSLASARMPTPWAARVEVLSKCTS